MSERTSKGLAANKAASNQLTNQAPISPSASEVRELIASRAYELYKHRGTAFGDELTDWLNAEAEVVTMLLAKSQETNGLTEKAQTRKAFGASKAADSARRRMSQWSKRKSALKGNLA
jgi:hypothetical protein